MAVKILEYLEATMRNQGLTRIKLADKMNAFENGSGNWTKEKLDKLFNNDNYCPRAETLSEIKQALGIPDFTPDYYRSKNGGREDS